MSVVVPAFNAGRFIEATLQSVLNQRYRNLEVLVVDDGSTDDTASRVSTLARADRRIHLIELGRNSGCPAVARNRGIREAGGELVAFLDADDLWARRKLVDQVSAMVRQPDLVLVYSMFVSFGVLHPLAREYGVKPLPFRAALNRDALERENTIPCSSVLTRLDLVKAVGGFDEDPKLAAVEDYDLWLRLSSHGPMGLVPRIHGFYRVHPEGISRHRDMTGLAQYLFAKRAISSGVRIRRQRGLIGRSVRAAVHTVVIVSAKLAEPFTPRVLRTLGPASRSGLQHVVPTSNRWFRHRS